MTDIDNAKKDIIMRFMSPIVSKKVLLFDSLRNVLGLQSPIALIDGI